MSKLDWNVLFKPIVLKKNKKDDEQIKKTGIEIKEAPKLDENKKIYFILTNALINFLVVIGTAGSFVKPFDIKCYMPVIWVVSLIIATFMAFLYYNMLTKTLGYFISLVAFLYGIFNLKYMIKGGFGYISNKLMAFFENSLISSDMLPNVTSTTFCTSARLEPSSIQLLEKFTIAATDTATATTFPTFLNAFPILAVCLSMISEVFFTVFFTLPISSRSGFVEADMITCSFSSTVPSLIVHLPPSFLGYARMHTLPSSPCIASSGSQFLVSCQLHFP